MPLDPDIRKKYPDNWDDLRRAVLERSTGTGPLDSDLGILARSPKLQEIITSHYSGPSPACEQCGVPQGEIILRYDGLWTLASPPEVADQIWFDLEGELVTTDDFKGDLPSPGQADEVKVLLSVAHRCQDPRCDELDHLLALCRRCHMRLDFKPEHFYTRKLLYRELKGQQRLECCREPGCEVMTLNKV